MATPHDALFRSTFGQVEHVRSLLRWLAPPELATGIDWASLRAWPTAQSSERLRLQHADLLFAADWPGDAPVFFLLEHKAATTGDVVRQLHRYVVHIDAEWQRAHSTVPFVVPIVIRHGRGVFAARWRSFGGPGPPSPVAAALARFDPDVRILADDLEVATEHDLLERPLTPLARLTLLCLRFAARWTDTEMTAALERWAPLVAAVGRSRDATRGGVVVRTPPDRLVT